MNYALGTINGRIERNEYFQNKLNLSKEKNKIKLKEIYNIHITKASNATNKPDKDYYLNKALNTLKRLNCSLNEKNKLEAQIQTIRLKPLKQKKQSPFITPHINQINKSFIGGGPVDGEIRDKTPPPTPIKEINPNPFAEFINTIEFIFCGQ